jgi:hypothetical protein
LDLFSVQFVSTMDESASEPCLVDSVFAAKVFVAGEVFASQPFMVGSVD